MRYSTSNLWESFKRDCPLVARIPVLRHYAFGVYVRAYFNAKLPE